MAQFGFGSRVMLSILKKLFNKASVGSQNGEFLQCCGAGAAGAAGAATFRAAPEPEPIFLLVGAGSRSRTF